jgi:hypothetical protein
MEEIDHDHDARLYIPTGGYDDEESRFLIRFRLLQQLLSSLSARWLRTATVILPP